MAKRFTRNIRSIKDIEKQPKNTNQQNDLLSDDKHVYVRNKDQYEQITGGVKEVNGETPDENGNVDLQLKDFTGQEKLVRKNQLEEFNETITTQLAQNNQLREVSFITPYDYDAVGDGVADDTEALREALHESHLKGTILFFPSGCKCRVTEPLNVRNGDFYDITLNIVGSLPNAKSGYVLDVYGGIRLDNETALFKNAKIKGSISNMSNVGKRNDNYRFFDNCSLYGVSIKNNNITNFGSFIYDSEVKSITKITENEFLSVFNFITCKGYIDSFITNNYINGGAEPTDNVCFGFSDGNGSVIRGNFVDYYHTIFKPREVGSTQIPTSIGNQYQVFLYFYDFDNVESSVTFLSSGDTFNWTLKSSLDHLKKYEEKQVTAPDGSTHIAPTYIFAPRFSSGIVIENAKIESHVGNIVFISDNITEYLNGLSKASFIGVSRRHENKITYFEGEAPYYNGGDYQDNLIEPYFIINVDELPSVKSNWAKFPLGTRVRHNNQNYRLVRKYDTVDEKMANTWIETPEL